MWTLGNVKTGHAILAHDDGGPKTVLYIMLLCVLCWRKLTATVYPGLHAQLQLRFYKGREYNKTICLSTLWYIQTNSQNPNFTLESIQNQKQ